jgi:hypothetical protein
VEIRELDTSVDHINRTQGSCSNGAVATQITRYVQYRTEGQTTPNGTY